MSAERTSERPDEICAVISREELCQKLAAGGVLLLDAQAPGWYERERLPGALRIPEVDVARWMQEVAPDRDIEIVVYCWSELCFASEIAAQTLAGFGYRNVRRYVGGKKDWLEAGLPIAKCGERARMPAEESAK